MELLNNWINGVNDILWSYILIIMLLGCAVWFTIKSRFVQFRMIGEMIRLLGDSAGKGEKGEKGDKGDTGDFPSLRRIFSQPCRNRKPSRCSDSRSDRRTRIRILDVADRFAWFFQRIRGVYVSSII